MAIMTHELPVTVSLNLVLTPLRSYMDGFCCTQIVGIGQWLLRVKTENTSSKYDQVI